MSQVLIPQRTKIAILLGLVVMGIALWKWDQTKPEVSANPTLPETPGPFSRETPPANQQREHQQDTDPQLTAVAPAGSEWQNCVEKPESIANLTELLEASVPQKSLSQSEIAIENLHIQTTDGRELRLHQRINDLSKKPEMLLFGVDAEGYPERRPFPASLQKQSFEEKRAWFLRQGREILSEKVRDLNSDGIHGRWREKNGQVTELELVFPERSLSCGNSLSSCRCRR